MAKFGGKSIIASAGAFYLDLALGAVIDNNNDNNQDNSEILAIIENQKILTKLQNESIYEQRMASFKQQEYDDLVRGIMLMKNLHYDTRERITNVLTNDIKDNFFDIVDFTNFTKTVENINKSLTNDYSLPQVSYTELVAISRIRAHKNMTYVGISIEIPMVNHTDSTNVSELIPIPYLFGTETRIFDINSELFLKRKQQWYTMPRSVFDICKRTGINIYCNSMEIMNLEKPNNCTISLILSKKPQCESKIIPTQTYWMKTSQTSIYWYVVEPIKFKVTCGDTYNIYILKRSAEIALPRDCDINEITKNVLIDTDLQIESEISQPFLKLNVSIYNSLYKNWTYNVTNIDKNNVISSELLANIIKLEQKAKERRNPGLFRRVLTTIAVPFRFIMTLLGNHFGQIVYYIISIPCILVILCLFKRN